MEKLFAKLKDPGTGFNYFEMISNTSGAVDNNAQKIIENTDPNKTVKLPILLLAQYEINSTNPKIKDIKTAYKQYDNVFICNFYQTAAAPITVIMPVDISSKNNSEKVYKLSFSVAVSITEQGKKDGFVGARSLVKTSQNGRNKIGISLNYQNATHNFLVNVNDKKLVGYNKADNKIYYTNSKDFDYRFGVNIIFTLN